MIKINTAVDNAKHHALAGVVGRQTMAKPFCHHIHSTHAESGIQIGFHFFGNGNALHFCQRGNGFELLIGHTRSDNAGKPCTDFCTERLDCGGGIRIFQRNKHIHPIMHPLLINSRLILFVGDSGLAVV